MTTASSSLPARGRRVAVLIAGGLLVALAGCNGAKLNRYEIVGAVPEDYRLTHPIAIDEAIETLDVPVGLNSGKLPAATRSNIQFFAQKFVTSRSAVIAIVMPKGSPNERVAAYAAQSVKDVLIGAGVGAGQIDMRVYRAESRENTAPVRLAYARIAAKTAPCGPWPDQAAKSSENRHYYNYGCASQQNLAAMVDNPLDLLYPRGETSPDAGRRATVLERYRNGSATQGDYARESGGNVAQGVGN